MVVAASEEATKVVAVVGSEADTEATEVNEVGMVEEEVSAIKVEVDLVVAHLLMLLVVRVEEVGTEDTMIDEMVTEVVVGMAADETEEEQAATETP